MAELAVRNLQFGPGAADDGEILAPVELEGLIWPKGQGHEGAPGRCPMNLLALLLPGLGERSHPVVRAVITQADQVTI